MKFLSAMLASLLLISSGYLSAEPNVTIEKSLQTEIYAIVPLMNRSTIIIINDSAKTVLMSAQGLYTNILSRSEAFGVRR